MTEKPARGRKPSPEIRQSLLDAALQLIAERGVDSSATREIAERAGTTERTLFKHFGSKAGLVQEVITTLAGQFFSGNVIAALQRPGPMSASEFAAWHRAMLVERCEAALRSPVAYRVLFAELLRDDAFRLRFSALWQAGALAPLAARLRAMQEGGAANRQVDATALAAAFFSLNLSYLMARFALAPEMAWSGLPDIEAIVSIFQASLRI